MSRPSARGACQISESSDDKLPTRRRGRSRSTLTRLKADGSERCIVLIVLAFVFVTGYLLVSWRRLGLPSLARCDLACEQLHHVVVSIAAQVCVTVCPILM
jgi:hypothetical protein